MIGEVSTCSVTPDVSLDYFFLPFYIFTQAYILQEGTSQILCQEQRIMS